MKISLSKRIENYLKKHGGWVHKGKLEELAKQATYIKKGKVCHYLAENADRRCREMVFGISSTGAEIPIVLERREVGNSVEYRYKTDIIEEKKPILKEVERDGVRTMIYV